MSTHVELNNTINKVNEFLRKQVQTNTQNDLKNESKKSNKNFNNVDLIKNVNDKVLVEILSPEVAKNESAKRKHKYMLISLLGAFLIIQFYAVYTISSNVITYSTTIVANSSIIKSLLAFTSAYITSVIIELIAILKYIVHNVFDTSIADLVKIFKDSNNNKEQES